MRGGEGGQIRKQILVGKRKLEGREIFWRIHLKKKKDYEADRKKFIHYCCICSICGYLITINIKSYLLKIKANIAKTTVMMNMMHDITGVRGTEIH